MKIPVTRAKDGSNEVSLDKILSKPRSYSDKNIKIGGAGLFDHYINAHGKRLFQLCLKLCADREDAQDLYQETWIKAYRFFDRYDSEQEFEGWLTTI
jgi:DNA-directed RNA polymerase specialized sigma24 family protein